MIERDTIDIIFKLRLLRPSALLFHGSQKLAVLEARVGPGEALANSGRVQNSGTRASTRSL